MAKNNNLSKAKKEKNDEFYTQLSDIEKELRHYKDQLKGKVIFCNCDDPESSYFWLYFQKKFEDLGLKKLISTHYETNKPSYKLEYDGIDKIETPLQQNGDFRSDEAIEILKQSDIVVTNPPFSCYSSDTEVMTINGWKLIKDVNINTDIIMSLNPKTKTIEMVKAVDYITSPVNGKMYNFKSHNMDFLVTSNHKMYSYYKNNKGENIKNEMLEAKDIKKSHLLPLTGFKWEGSCKQYFTLPSVKQKEQCSRKDITIPNKIIDMKYWLEFFGFYLADGCVRQGTNSQGNPRYTVSIKQNIKNEEYVIDLFKRIGFDCKIYKRSDGNNNYEVYSKQLWTYLNTFGKSSDKYIPRDFINLNKEYLEKLLYGYTNGDSHIGSNIQEIIYSSISKTLMDNIQEIILKVYGQISKVREVNSIYNGSLYKYYIISLQKELIHRNYAKYGKPIEIDYNGNVYCLQLEKNHIMLVRRNNTIGWSGNCFREYISQLIEYDKKFLIVGNQNAITYREIFPSLKSNKVWLGYGFKGSVGHFINEHYIDYAKASNHKEGMIRVSGVVWYTNMNTTKRNENLILYKTFNTTDYPKYDNYNAINVNKVIDIPIDYIGVMGVPITFMNKYNPNQFEIVDAHNAPVINGKKIYKRIIIKRTEKEV